MGRDAQVSGHGVGEGAMDGGSVKHASQISKMGHKTKESLTKSKGKGKVKSDGNSLIERRRWECIISQRTGLILLHTYQSFYDLLPYLPIK
jgi:hypothetical protein